MEDINCPYCDRLQEINHDDGYGYEEGVLHQQECGGCGKTFTFNTSICFYYEAFKADCLNGSPHDWYAPVTYPAEFTEMLCRSCEQRRKPTPEEMQQILANNKPH